MSTKDLRTSIASMLETANKASNQARVIEDKFGKIRVELIKMSGNVHSRLVEIGAGEIGAVRSPPTPRATTAIEARGGLCRAQEDLDGLSASVVHFCIWWKNIADQLGVIETISHEMAAGGSAIFPAAKIQEVQERWLSVRRRYDLYVHQIEQIHADLVQMQRKSGSRFLARGLAAASSIKESDFGESAEDNRKGGNAKEAISLAEKQSKILAEGRRIALEAKGLEEECRQMEEIRQTGARRRTELEEQARILEQEKKGLEDETKRLTEERKRLEEEERRVEKERRRVQEEIQRFEKEMEEGRRSETEKAAEIEGKRKALEDRRTAQEREVAEIGEALKTSMQEVDRSPPLNEEEAADDQVPRRRRYERRHKRRHTSRARS
jgi:hypothetical protein